MDSSNLSQFAALSALSGVLLVSFLIFLIPTIFFLLTLQKALTRVAPERRTMNPPMVWLGLIPLFSVVWRNLDITDTRDKLMIYAKTGLITAGAGSALPQLEEKKKN